MPVKNVLWSVFGIVCLVIVSITILSAMNRPTDVIVSLTATMVVPTVTALLVLIRVEKIGAATEEVRKNVNGNLSALVDKLPAADQPPNAAAIHRQVQRDAEAA